MNECPPDPESLREVLRTVIDPEAGLNIVDLGLVYRVDAQPGVVRVALTMTSPACPMGDMIMGDVELALREALPPDTRIEVELVWSPPWDPSMMSAKARKHFDW